MVDLTVIEGDKNRPYAVAEISSEEEDGVQGHVTELVIVHRKIEQVMTSSGPVPTQSVVTPAFSIADRAVGEAFCKAINDFSQFWEEFDWDAHDMDQDPPVFMGRDA